MNHHASILRSLSISKVSFTLKNYKRYLLKWLQLQKTHECIALVSSLKKLHMFHSSQFAKNQLHQLDDKDSCQVTSKALTRPSDGNNVVKSNLRSEILSKNWTSFTCSSWLSLMRFSTTFSLSCSMSGIIIRFSKSYSEWRHSELITTAAS